MGGITHGLGDKLPPYRQAQATRKAADKAIAQLMETVNRSVSAALSPALQAIGTGQGTSADFRALTRALRNLETHRLGDLADQVAAFELEVIEMELNPDHRDFHNVRYALKAAAVLAAVFEGREWTPGREDLTPLFELEELEAS